jgi:Tfp pilus assembly protein PilN
MTTQTTVVGTPTLPRVNLLPPEIAEARTLKQYRFAAAGGVAATAVLVGVFYWHAHGGVATAQASLDASNAKTAALRTQLASYQSVTQIRSQVDSAKQTLATALAPQVLWSRYLQDMSVSLPGNYWFNTVVMTTGSGGTAPAAGTTASPLSDPSPVGTLTLTGTAVSHYDVADLLRSLAKEQGMSSSPVVLSSAEDATPLVGNHKMIKFSVSETIHSTLKSGAGTTGVATPTAPTATGTTATPTTSPTTAPGH